MSKTNTQAANERLIKDLKDKILIRNQAIKNVKRQLCDCVKYILINNSVDAETFPIDWCFNTTTETDKALKQELLNVKNEEFEHHFIKTANGRLIKLSGFNPELPELCKVKCKYSDILKRLEQLEKQGVIEKQYLNCWVIHCIDEELIKYLTEDKDEFE